MPYGVQKYRRWNLSGERASVESWHQDTMLVFSLPCEGLGEWMRSPASPASTPHKNSWWAQVCGLGLKKRSVFVKLQWQLFYFIFCKSYQASCTRKVLYSFYRQRKWGPEKLKDLPQVTQQVGSRTSNRTQIPGSRTLSIILSYLPHDTMKLEKKIFHGPGLTNTTSLLSPILFSHHTAASGGVYTRKNLWGGKYTAVRIFSKNILCGRTEYRKK